MKLPFACFLSLVGFSYSSSAAKPHQLSVNLQNGNFPGVDGLNPILSCEGSSKEGEVEFTYGLDLALNPTRDIKSLPRSIWGKTKANIGGWMTSVRAEVDAQSLDSINFAVTSNKDEHDLSIKVAGSYSKLTYGTLSKVQATKIYKGNTTTVSITPRYIIETEEADVVVGYMQDKAEFEIIASKTAQQITLSQQVKEDNRLSTTLTSDGSVSIEWERTLGVDKSVTTCLKPNQSLDVDWKDRGWITNINVPMNAMDVKGVNVVIKRGVTF